MKGSRAVAGHSRRATDLNARGERIALDLGGAFLLSTILSDFIVQTARIVAVAD
jgi:hypothetical protein